jgi:hypothetical protein
MLIRTGNATRFCLNFLLFLLSSLWLCRPFSEAQSRLGPSPTSPLPATLTLAVLGAIGFGEKP